MPPFSVSVTLNVTVTVHEAPLGPVHVNGMLALVPLTFGLPAVAVVVTELVPLAPVAPEPPVAALPPLML